VQKPLLHWLLQQLDERDPPLVIVDVQSATFKRDGAGHGRALYDSSGQRVRKVLVVKWLSPRC